MKIALTFVLVVAAACGGKSAPATSTTTQEHQAEHQAEHPKMSAEVTKFHDVLSPRWHADKGEKRMQDTCAAMVEFQTNVEALVKASPPAGADTAKWTTGTQELRDAVVALDASCKANDATAFEPAFHRVHEGFHVVMEVGGGKHGEHGEHGHHGGEHNKM